MNTNLIRPVVCSQHNYIVQPTDWRCYEPGKMDEVKEECRKLSETCAQTVVLSDRDNVTTEFRGGKQL